MITFEPKMSDNYIVSARKYRPQTFDTVVGQDHITTTLKNAIRHQHLAHAYLFCGPRGVGKTTCARILSKTINCEHPSEDMEACGVCGSCQSFSNNASFNIFELDAASNNSVDDIRELVNQVRFAPQQGKYKIYIIDEVHMLSAAAFNAFLKTLEEPPSYAIFILATTEKHKILPTILSRCQIFDFKRITTEHIVGHLQSIAAKEAMIADEAALHVIAQKSEGCMRDALSMLDRIASFTNGHLNYALTMEHLNMLDADFYFKLTDHLLSQDVSGSLLLLDEVLERGFEGNVILQGLAEHFRNLLLCRDVRMARLLDVPNDHKPIYFEKANQTPPSYILSALNQLNESELNFRNATNKRLHVEMCFIRLCYLMQATQAEDLKKNFSSDLTLAPSLPIAPKTAPTQVPYSAPAAPELKVEEPKIVPAKTNSHLANPTSPNTSRRISKNLLDDIEQEIKSSIAENQGKNFVLEEAAVLPVFEAFKEQLRNESKSFLLSLFSVLKIELLGNDEIKLIAPNEMSEATIKEQRNQLIDYFSEKLGSKIRITTEVRPDPELEKQLPKVLSKQEIFEKMALKNPALKQLKDTLNLQIDF